MLDSFVVSLERFQIPKLSAAEVREVQQRGIGELRERRIVRLRRAAARILGTPSCLVEAKEWLTSVADTETEGVRSSWLAILNQRSPEEIASFLLGDRGEFGAPGNPFSGDFDEQLRLSVPPQFLASSQ